MGERSEKIEREFPPGINMPNELRELCDFLDRTEYPLSGYMRLRPEGEGLKLWFGADSVAWRQLAGFGAGPDGSVLAFWLHNNQDVTKSPIVHLGSEGTHLFLIADDFRDFLALVAIGYDELGFDDLDQPPNEPESAERLRLWLASRYGIVPPTTGAEIVRRGQSRHPNFKEWVYDAQELRDRLREK